MKKEIIKGELILLRRLSICTLLTAFMFTLFTFNGSAFAATNTTENETVVAACAKGGTVGTWCKDAQWFTLWDHLSYIHLLVVRKLLAHG